MKSNPIKEPETPSRSKKTGTRQWSEHSLNSHTGCSNGCRYCYARYRAVCRFKQISAADWPKMRPRRKVIDGNFHKKDGVIMYPTTHDITPATLDDCMTVLGKVLAAGNKVLVVSKPRWECVDRMCRELAAWRDKLEFRFSIGSLNDWVLRAWEPSAPGYDERVQCLELAARLLFRTSVSAEPFLDDDVEGLYRVLSPYITEGFWVGKLNKLDPRVDTAAMATFRDGRVCLEIVRRTQTNEAIRALYERMKGLPKVRWKESIEEVVGA